MEADREVAIHMHEHVECGWIIFTEYERKLEGKYGGEFDWNKIKIKMNDRSCNDRFPFFRATIFRHSNRIFLAAKLLAPGIWWFSFGMLPAV